MNSQVEINRLRLLGAKTKLKKDKAIEISINITRKYPTLQLKEVSDTVSEEPRSPESNFPRKKWFLILKTPTY